MAQPIPPPSQRRPDLPPELDRIVMKALERRPEDRYSSAAEMRADLEEFLRGTPSVPGTSQLAQYMQGLFGQSHVEHKTKVPSLTELAAIPSPPEAEVRRPLHTDIMGLEKTLIRPSEAHGVPAVGAPASAPAPAPAPVPAPVPVSAPPARSTGLTMAIGALAAVALLAIGGGAAWYFMPRPQPQGPVVVTTPPVAPPVVAQPTPPPTPPPTPAPPSPTPPVAELAKPPPQEPPVNVRPPREAPPRPQTPKQGRDQSPFSQAAINQVMRPHLAKLEQCAKAHRETLPPSTRVTLLITVESTGAVANTQIANSRAVPDSLAQCLKAEMSKVTFKADARRPEVQIELPFVLKR